jgi:hypothetical protein
VEWSTVMHHAFSVSALVLSGLLMHLILRHAGATARQPRWYEPLVHLLDPDATLDR